MHASNPEDVATLVAVIVTAVASALVAIKRAVDRYRNRNDKDD